MTISKIESLKLVLYIYYLMLQHRVAALFPIPKLLFFFVCVCPSVCPTLVCFLFVHLSVCPKFVCLSVCLSVCLHVCTYVFFIVINVIICLHVYTYVVFIVINVFKLLYVRRPTSSPRAVWNPCKKNKASNQISIE